MALPLRFACACLLALLVLDARAAFALAPQRFALSWVREPGAEACSTGHRLGTLVTHMLGPVLATPDEADVAIEGSVRNDAGAWRARIAITDRAGQVLGRRELQSGSPSCAALDAQVLLVIAIAIDPEVALEGLSPELLGSLAASGDVAEDLLAELRQQAPATTAHAKTASPPAHQEPAAKPQPASRSQQTKQPERDLLSIRIGPTLSLGHSPSPVFGAGIALELRPLPRWALALHGAWLAPSTVAIDNPGLQPASVRFELQTLSLSGCGAPLLSSTWRANACAGVLLARRHAHSEGLANATNETRLDASLQIATSLAYLALRPWSIIAGAALDLPLQRTRFSYRTSIPSRAHRLFMPSAVGLMLSIAFGVEL